MSLRRNSMKQFKYLAILFFAATSTQMQASWQNWQEWYDNQRQEVIRATTRLNTLDMIRANARENNQLNEQIIPLKEVVCELDTNTAVVKNGSQSVTGKITTSYAGREIYTQVNITRTAINNDYSNKIDFDNAITARRIKARNDMVKYNVPAEITTNVEQALEREEKIIPIWLNEK